MRVFRMFIMACLLIGLMGAFDVGQAQSTRIRWDIVSLPNGAPPVVAGGIAYARAADGSTLKITGSGTFGSTVLDPVDGGGQWTLYDNGENVIGEGTYTVTGLVRFTEAPGGLPADLPERIGDPADARAGLAVLRIAYSDGDQGLLMISCHLVESPASVGEGIAATKGFTLFSRVAPIPGIDANRTVFHIVR